MANTISAVTGNHENNENFLHETFRLVSGLPIHKYNKVRRSRNNIAYLPFSEN
jgi:hypothetical protein